MAVTEQYLVTTVNIVAPVSVQEHVGRLHRAHRPDRLMKAPAHFTVLHPFVGYAEFPERPLYDGEFGPEPTPHVTVFETEEDAPALARRMPPYEPAAFTARELHVYLGNAESAPWLTAAIIPLGG